MVYTVRNLVRVPLFIVAVVFLTSCDEEKTIQMQPPGPDLTNGGRTLPSYGDVNRRLDDALRSPGQRRRPCVNPDAGRHNPPIADADEVDGRGACDIAGTNAQWKRNCKALINSGRVPNQAFLFALKAMKKNSSSFKSKKCYKLASSGHYSMKGMNKSRFEGAMSGGIPNKCQMMINNYDERITTHGGSYKCKTAQYYIDLCSGSPKVEKSFSYVGYGTCKSGRGFRNKSGQGTSLLGAFVTANHTFNFQKRDASYSAIARQLGGTVPATPLIGLQSSNNGASPDLKYLHVGAYTSAGCPSVPPKDAGKIKKLAANGPSLVVNYKQGQMEDIDKCSH